MWISFEHPGWLMLLVLLAPIWFLAFRGSRWHVLTRNVVAASIRSVVIVPLGYRATEGDWLENLKKVRRPTAQFVTEVN